MAINTLITIKDALDSFVSDHEQLKRIEWEADDHRAPVITSGDEFPMLFAAPIDVTIGRAMNTHTIRIYVYERINDSRDDVIENANDTSLILRDIRVWWNEYGTDDILILDDPLGTFVSDRELDNLVGYYADFTFEIPSHGRCQVPIDVTPSPSPTCDPATYTITDDAGNTLYSGSITSGGSLTQEITDSTAVLKDSAGSTISTTSINAQASADITAPDGTVTITDDSANVLHTVNVKSNGSASQVISDSTVENSDASYSVGVNAEGSLVLPDSQINVNSVSQGNVVSVKTVDVNIQDSGGAVTPDSVSLVGNTLTVTVPSGGGGSVGAKPIKTGQTTSYASEDDGATQRGRLVDFFTLDSNNAFGNTNRFTDLTGGQTYASNGVFLDHSTDNGSEILAFTNSPTNTDWSGTLTSIAAQSTDGKTDWYMPNRSELELLINEGVNPNLNWTPLATVATIFSGNLYCWTSTTPIGNTARAKAFYSSTAIDGNEMRTYGKPLGARSLACRYYTYAELGL